MTRSDRDDEPAAPAARRAPGPDPAGGGRPPSPAVGSPATSMEDVAAEAGITRLIVYRHFDSKEDLYRAVLTRVTERLAEEWAKGLASGDRRLRVPHHPHRRPRATRRLPVAVPVRRPGAAVRGLRRGGVRAVQVALADEMLGETIADPAFRAWATHTIVGYLDDSVLAWLEVGDPDRDAEFVERATDGLIAMYRAWSAARVDDLRDHRPGPRASLTQLGGAGAVWSVLEGQELGGDALELGGPAVGGRFGQRQQRRTSTRRRRPSFSMRDPQRRQAVRDELGRVVEVGTAAGDELRRGRPGRRRRRRRSARRSARGRWRGRAASAVSTMTGMAAAMSSAVQNDGSHPSPRRPTRCSSLGAMPPSQSSRGCCTGFGVAP